MNSKVSVIVPAYNGTKFLNKCMDSLAEQTYKNIEIIFLDDGSTDDTYSVIKKFEKEYDNVIACTHSNVGLSITRNIGVSKSTGDYVTYLDVDDYFDNDFIERMMDEIGDNDIIIGSYKRVYEDGKVKFTYEQGNGNWAKYKRATVWAKIYKVDFLKKNNIEYPNTRIYGEDVVYTMRCMSKEPKVKIIDYAGYNNLINSESITHKDKNKLIRDVPKMIANINSFIKDNTYYLSKNEKIIKYYYLKLFCNFLFEQSEFLELSDLKDYYYKNLNDIKHILKEYRYSYSFIWEKNDDIKVNMFVNLMVFFNKIKLDKLFITMIHKQFYKNEEK